MEKWWFGSLLFSGELERGCRLSKSMAFFGPFENTSVSEDQIIDDMDMDKDVLIVVTSLITVMLIV